MKFISKMVLVGKSDEYMGRWQYSYEQLNVYRVAYLHAQGLKQYAIAKLLGLSKAKVNRLLKQAYNQGILEVKLNLACHNVLFLEQKLKACSNLKEAIVVPRPSNDPEHVLSVVSTVGAQYLQERLREGHITMAIGGGRTLYRTIVSIGTEHPWEGLKVVPALGGAQGEHDTAVNYLAGELARRVKAQFYQLLVPAFCTSASERDMLINIPQIRSILEVARKATVILLTVGAITPEVSSFHKFTRIPSEELARIIEQERGVAELLAQIIDEDGQPCALEYARRVVGLTLEELQSIPFKIGIAALEHKVKPICAALRGNFLDVLITDEVTAAGVVRELEGK